MCEKCCDILVFFSVLSVLMGALCLTDRVNQFVKRIPGRHM